MGALRSFSGVISDVGTAATVFDDAIDSMSVAQVFGPRLLPGWSRGHVVAHVVLNAEGFIEVSHALQAGRVAVMYPAGVEARDANIAQLSTAPLGVL